jgi:hypothetical protein
MTTTCTSCYDRPAATRLNLSICVVCAGLAGFEVLVFGLLAYGLSH